jgi:outer membrane protein insertion porin family
MRRAVLLVLSIFIATILGLAIPAFAQDNPATPSPEPPAPPAEVAPSEQPPTEAAPSEEAPAEENLMISAIEIRGNELIPDQDILAVMKGRAGSAFSLNQLSADLAAIEALGWFAAEPEHTLEPFEGGVKIIIAVQENPIFHGVAITQNGPGIYPPGELALLFPSVEGQIINNIDVTGGLGAIERRYREDGYTAATVTDMDITDDGIIHVEITEGVIAEIVVQGNTKTRTHVITRELTTKVGDVFNAITFRRDLERVYNLQLFEDLQPSFEMNENQQVTLYINVVEARTGQLGFGAGYSSNDGFMGTLSYSERNFRGVGQRITALGQIGGPNPDFDLSFFNPVIDSHKTSLSLEGFLFNESDRLRGETDSEEDVIPFELRRKGGTIGVVRPTSDNVTVSLTLKFLKGTVTFLDDEGNPLPADQIPDLSDSEWVQNGLIDGTSNSLTGEVAYDTRDFSLDPSRGMYASVQTSMIGHVLGGDFNAFKYQLEYRNYLPLSKVSEDITELSPQRTVRAHVVAFRIFYGGSAGDLPLIERYEIGGQNTVRGAEETQQSGDQAILFNTEYRFPLAGNLGGAIFFDAGTAAPPGTGIDFGDFVTTVGLGIRYRISFFGIAPLRLDYGYDLDSHQARIVFGFGQLF